MPKKKIVIKKSQKTPKVSFFVLILIVCVLLGLDGLLRIFFSFSSINGTGIQLFQLRWLCVGISEVFLSFGLYKLKKWALYILLLLSLYRIYTLYVFHPNALFPPEQNNLLFYTLKMISVVSIFYLVAKHKYFNK
jgi:hypothetical protein